MTYVGMTSEAGDSAKYLKKEGKWLRWEEYAAVYEEDKDKSGGLRLYQTLSIYALLKPPKFGNCGVVEGEKPLQDTSDFRALVGPSNFTASSADFVDEVKLTLDNLICVEDWECDDVLSQTKGRSMN
ncbi:hypothetical protein HPB52_010395 [Rhipicephalus sanguineus]|uniref:Uncharacterized protein n=1 Tax=Rhipicephalus sanguineus TaxID=34632 RepID=A0A9D4QFM3_RHISA|nr:hypothetical protein HPB52_010395 [Rhipicephalus sanguineus]